MSENTNEEVAAGTPPALQNEQNQNPENPENLAPETTEIQSEKNHTKLAEAELESSLSNVLPLSAINASNENSEEKIVEKKQNERHGLRRGNASKTKKNGASANVGVVENPAEFTESLSGSGPKPRERRNDFPRKKFNEKRGNENFSNENSEKSQKSAPEKSFRHPQSNSKNSNSKLFIEPVEIPEQKTPPSLFSRFAKKVLSILGFGKKQKNKKGKGGKFHGKYRPKKDFGNGKNFNRNKNFHHRNGKNRRYNKNGNRYGNSGNSAPKA